MPFGAWLISLIAGAKFSFKSFILWMFATYAISFILKLLIGLGVGYVTYNVSSYSLDYVFNLLSSEAAGLPPEMIGIFATLRIGDAISVIFTAYSIRLALIGFQAGQKRVLSFTN